jgi:hypothetical protein
MNAKLFTSALILILFTASSWARPCASPYHSVNISRCQNIAGQELLNFEAYAAVSASVGRTIEQVKGSAFPHSFIHVESVSVEPATDTPQYEVNFERTDGSIGRTTVTCEQTVEIFSSHYDG